MADTKLVLQRLDFMIKQFQSPNDQVKSAFTKIGLILQSQIKLNIRQQGLIDTGTLLNSIRYEFTTEGGRYGIQIGSYGVKYAAAHEFGKKGIVQVRAHTRTITNAFGRRIAPTVVSVRPHGMDMNIRSRPYVRPAINKQKGNVIDLIRAAYNYKATT